MNKDHIKTSDHPYAAYLMLHDFTHFATVDPEDGKGRCDFYLTHADPAIRENIFEVANELRDKMNGEDDSYVKFYRHLKKLSRSIHTAVKKSEVAK